MSRGSFRILTGPGAETTRPVILAGVAAAIEMASRGGTPTSSAILRTARFTGQSWFTVMKLAHGVERVSNVTEPRSHSRRDIRERRIRMAGRAHDPLAGERRGKFG
ncbi:MAG: hypothetical protein HPY55_07615 [Firmicutes bacterium]|nr:hypothetical protein [Bacillota bacterium]